MRPNLAISLIGHCRMVVISSLARVRTRSGSVGWAREHTRRPERGGFEVVVGTDGALTVPAEELARHGVRPGAHLRLVQEPQPRAPRRSARGALAGVINADELDAFEVALDNSKAERIAAAERRWA